MTGTAIVRTAPGSAIIRPAAGSGGSPVVRTLVPGSVTSSDLAASVAAERAISNGAYVSGSIAQDWTVEQLAQARDNLKVAGAINVRSPRYGVKADGVSAADGAITTGTANFASTTATFTGADVGKIIRVSGAGAGGSLLSTTILTYTDAHHVVLAASAGTSVSAALFTYGTDDTANFNAALSDVDPANGITDVYVPDGVYLINGVSAAYPAGVSADRRNKWIGAGLIPPSGTRMLLSPNAELRVIPNNSTSYAVVYVGRGQDNVTIRGGRIVGDRASHDYVTELIYTTHEWGFGVGQRGCKRLTLDGVSFSGCTGDSTIIDSEGQLTISPYYPAERILITGGCVFDGARRNNISIIGCDLVTIENNIITNAGTNDGVHAGTVPKYGIDIEGNGDAFGVDWQTPLNVTIRNNKFVGNALGAIMDFNGYGVDIHNNWCYDGQNISYGFGTEPNIHHNTLKSSVNVGNAIQSNGSGTYRSNAKVNDNIIIGWAVGIQVQRDYGDISGNWISGFSDTGISVFGCTDITVSDNDIIDGVTVSGSTPVAIKANTSTSPTISNNRVKNVRTAVSLINSTVKATVQNNTIEKGYQGVNVGAGCAATVKDNTIDLPGHADGQSYDITAAGTSKVTIKNNTIRNSSTYSINVTNAAGGRARVYRNDIVDSTNTTAIFLSGGTHSCLNNVITSDRNSGGGGPAIVVSGATGSIFTGNTGSHIGSVAYTKLIDSSASTTSSISGNSFDGTLVATTHVSDFLGPNFLLGVATPAVTATDRQAFATSGTWVNPSPSTARPVLVRGISAGNGGGSGRRGGAASLRTGGAGGAAGAPFQRWLLTTDLPATVAVTVGTGGTGGAAVTTDDTDGNPGTTGGSTFFGAAATTYLAGMGNSGSAAGGRGGSGTGAAAGGTSLASGPAGGASSATGGAGSGGNAASLANGLAIGAAGAGAGGGGLTTGNAESAGGGGGGLSGGLASGGTAGTATGGDGADGSAAPATAYGVGGTGGGGGGSRATGGRAGNGGKGGKWAAGGGGGGASLNGNNSGQGGDGADGYLEVITFP